MGRVSVCMVMWWTWVELHFGCGRVKGEIGRRLGFGVVGW
jgi:hypothetical protein